MAILDRFPGDYTITATTNGEALLEIRETWLPGWKAANNGELVAVIAVDDLFIGIPLDDGEHQVHVYYQPEGWRWGWPITLGTIIFLLVWTVAEIRQEALKERPKLEIRQD